MDPTISGTIREGDAPLKKAAPSMDGIETWKTKNRKNHGNGFGRASPELWVWFWISQATVGLTGGIRGALLGSQRWGLPY
jgi:hypothetical protein